MFNNTLLKINESVLKTNEMVFNISKTYLFEQIYSFV